MAKKTRVRRIVDLAEVGLGDVALVGGKGANLGEMIAAGFPVPPGFVVTAEAYLDAMDLAGLRDELAGVRAQRRRADPRGAGRGGAEGSGLRARLCPADRARRRRARASDAHSDPMSGWPCARRRPPRIRPTRRSPG